MILKATSIGRGTNEDFENLFFPRGRIGRTDYWLFFLLGGVVLKTVLSLLASVWANGQSGTPIILALEVGLRFPFWSDVIADGRSFIVWLGAALWLWPQVVVPIKRLHDLNLSAVWFVAFAGASFVIQLVVVLGRMWGLMTPGVSPLWLVMSALGLAGLAAPVVLGLVPGQTGPNRFGPQPKRRADPARETQGAP